MNRPWTPAVGPTLALLVSSCICHAKILYHADYYDEVKVGDARSRFEEMHVAGSGRKR